MSIVTTNAFDPLEPFSHASSILVFEARGKARAFKFSPGSSAAMAGLIKKHLDSDCFDVVEGGREARAVLGKVCQCSSICG